VIGERQSCRYNRSAGAGGKLGGHRHGFSCSCQRILPGGHSHLDLAACRSRSEVYGDKATWEMATLQSGRRARYEVAWCLGCDLSFGSPIATSPGSVSLHPPAAARTVSVEFWLL
jgi:hypothetical protein